MIGRLLVPLLLLSAALSARPTNERQLLHALEEMRISLVDLQQTVARHKMDIALLEERSAGRSSDPSQQMRRLSEVEKMQTTLAEDMHQLKEHANQASASLQQCYQQISLLQKQLSKFEGLEGTLQSISKAINAGGRMHKVGSGDSLDKIARQYQTTVEALKQRNGLSSNTILIGQELHIPE
jgi:chromosome segregation ATPase